MFIIPQCNVVLPHEQASRGIGRAPGLHPGGMEQHTSPGDRQLPSCHRRSSGLSVSSHSGRLSLLDLREGADRRGKIADQAAKMAKQLQEVLTKNHVQHQNLRGQEHDAKSQLERVKGDLESAEVSLARRPLCNLRGRPSRALTHLCALRVARVLTRPAGRFCRQSSISARQSSKPQDLSSRGKKQTLTNSSTASGNRLLR